MLKKKLFFSFEILVLLESDVGVRLKRLHVTMELERPFGLAREESVESGNSFSDCFFFTALESLNEILWLCSV